MLETKVSRPYKTTGKIILTYSMVQDII